MLDKFRREIYIIKDVQSGCEHISLPLGSVFKNANVNAKQTRTKWVFLVRTKQTELSVNTLSEVISRAK